MKFSVWATLLLSASLGKAQYFSEGWKPGQPVSTPSPSPVHEFEAGGDADSDGTTEPKSIPSAQAESSKPDLLSLFDLNTYLETDVSKNLFARFGFNITEKLAAAKEMPWDKRISLITDENFQDIIVNEELDEEEAKDRVWTIVITAAAGRQDAVSNFVDEAFDDSFNKTVIAGDLPHVKWGRIDYFNVTYLTTKWNVWTAPYIVVLKDRGQTLRFYNVKNLRLRDAALRDFLLNEGYLSTPKWNSSYAPGGTNEYLIDFFATWMTKIYNFVVRIPKFLLVLGTGTIASFLLSTMHSASAPAKAAPKPPSRAAAPIAAPSSASTATASLNGNTSKSSKRKGKK